MLCMLRCVVVIVAIGSFLPGHANEHRARHPNVILMMADDLGYHDLSCYGSSRIRTPVLDALADDGVRLTNFHAGASVCSPSRMALLSGCYPARIGWRGGVLGHGMQKETGLSTEVVTIAEWFKANGYRTAIAGKWHVGDRNLRPLHHGFDATCFILASNNMNRNLYRGDECVEKDFDNRRLSERFTNEVVRQLVADPDTPFFIYVPFTAPHFPAEAHPEWDGRSTHGAYGDVVEELDARVGVILEALDAHSLATNTIVVFCSDNGPEKLQQPFASAHPMSGRKWTSREGGSRVPCIIRWPGVIKPGTETDALVAAIDLFSTLACACGIDVTLGSVPQHLDGTNVWGAITGATPGQGRDMLVSWHGAGKATAIHRGRWKLFFDAGPGDPDVTEGPVLFDLGADIGESRDVSADHPEVVRELLELAAKELADIDDRGIPLGVWHGFTVKADGAAVKASVSGRWLP